MSVTYIIQYYIQSNENDRNYNIEGKNDDDNNTCVIYSRELI